MASALIPKTFNKIAHSYYVSTPSGDSAKLFAGEFGISYLDYTEALSKLRMNEFDILWLAMKPQSFTEFRSVNKIFTCPALEIVSILAATDHAQISEVFSCENIIRLMPNTPTQFGVGVNPIWSKNPKSDLVLDLLECLNKFGASFLVPTEQALDIITPFSGSGPAYFFEIQRILENKLISLGFDKTLARIAIATTMKGSAQMILDSGLEPLTLRENVTSKKGVTYEALKIFSEMGLEKILDLGIDKALERIEELKK